MLGPERQVAIFANPVAGSGRFHHIIDELTAALERLGLAASICRHRAELTDWLGQQGPDVRCVVAAGGDGTLGEVLNRAPGVPVALLPLGTENLAARHVAADRSAERLAAAIAAGRLRRIDLGRANGRWFSLMASAGFDAEVVRLLHRHRRGTISRLTYVAPILKALFGYPYPVVEVEIPDTGERLRGAHVFAFNLPEYGFGLPIGRTAHANDGLLDVLILERPGVLNLFRYLAALLTGRHLQLGDVKYRRVREVRLSCEFETPLQIDGDPAGPLPATIEVVPGALRLITARGPEAQP